MNKSETIGKLATALSMAQPKIQGALKDSNNPFFKSKYANLESVMDACKGPLNEVGLSVSQVFDFQDGVDFLVTTLMHSSGEWYSGRMRLLYKDPTAQGMVAAGTYARRAGLAAICGVVQVDDDGEAASGRNPMASQTQSPPQKVRQQWPAKKV